MRRASGWGWREQPWNAGSESAAEASVRPIREENGWRRKAKCWSFSKEGKEAASRSRGPLAVALALAMYAWHVTTAGTATPFWFGLHKTYWRLYIVIGTLFVPAMAWLLKEKQQQSHNRTALAFLEG